LKTPNSENFEIKSLKLGEPPNKDIPNEDFEACQIKITKPPGGSTISRSCPNGKPMDLH